MWVRSAEPTGYLLSAPDAAPAHQFNIKATRLADGRAQISFLGRTLPPPAKATTVQLSASTPCVWDGSAWHHLVVMVDRGRLTRIYADGRLIAAASIVKLGRLTSNLGIGGWGPTMGFTGDLDEIRFFAGTYGQDLVDHLYCEFQHCSAE
jgi:hypothetical protein